MSTVDRDSLAAALHSVCPTENYGAVGPSCQEYADAILAALPEPGLDVERLFGLTLDEVRAAIATADMYHPTWRAAPREEGTK